MHSTKLRMTSLSSAVRGSPRSSAHSARYLCTICSARLNLVDVTITPGELRHEAHGRDFGRNNGRRVSARDNTLRSDAGRHLLEKQAIGGRFEHCKFGHDEADWPRRGQRKRAF